MKKNSAILVLSILTAVSSSVQGQNAPSPSGVPVIFSISPVSGNNGTAVAISGTNFSASAISNIVYFGAVRANVLTAAPAGLTVTVPPGATHAPITVTVGGLTAYSGRFFEPTFAGSSSNITVSNFAPSFDLATAASPSACIIADLDGDGKPDIALVCGDGAFLLIYRNISTNGVPLSTASFAPPTGLQFPTNGTGGNPYRLRAVDLDGDGKLDLIACEVSGNRVSVFHNLSTPGNLAFEPSFALIAGNDCRSVSAADLDGDGRVDIVALNYGNKTISLFKNVGTPGVLDASSFAAPVTIAAPGGPYEAVIADLNGDGLPDLAVAENDSGTVSIFQNAGGVLSSNTFPARFDLPCGTDTEGLVAADLLGDGRLDLIAGSYQSGTISVFQNISTGGVLTANSFAPRVDFGTGNWTHTLAIADFNGDGKPDIAVVGELPSMMSIFQNVGTSGTFTSASLAPRVDFSTGWNAWGVAAGNLDGDGRPDVIFCNVYDSTLQIYQNLAPFGTPAVAPSITAQPTNITVTVNGTAVFTVAANGTQPLNYQWFFEDTNAIAGATSATLTLTNVQPAQAGYYAVLVSNPGGAVVSSNALLTIYVPPTPPTILAQTPNQTVAVSNAVTFSVMASGSTPLSYFWSQNGVLVPSATNSSYTIFNVPLSDTGSSFSCLVTNAYGSATSSNIFLKVIETVANGLCNGAIVITNASYTNTQSTLQADAPGNPVLDCVGGFGHGVWYEFASPVAGLLIVDTFGSDYDTGLGLYTGSCDSLTEVACNDDFGGLLTSQVSVPTTAGATYYILAGGYNSDAGNLVLHLNYLTPPAFVTQPTNIFVVVSSNAIFNTTVSGTQPIGFQWYFNDTPLVDGGRISGSTTSTLTIANVETNDGGNYLLVASNIVGVTTSAVAVLTPVILPPTFIQPPVSQSVGLGSNAYFSAVVGGTPPFSYQWYFNGYPLGDSGRVSGSTTSSLIVSNLTAVDAGTYSLTVANSSGSTSAAATLTVLTPPVITLQPVGRSVPPGLPTIFTAAASGIRTPGYQWQLNGTNITGATSASYTNSAVGTNNLGFYTVVASNTMGMATSAAAQLTFGPVAAWGDNVYNENLPPPGLSNVIAVAGCSGASFAVRGDGRIVSWGGGIVTNIPANASNVVAISISGTGNAYALRADGTVVGWSGILEPPNPALPPLSNIVAVAAGAASFGLALRAEGTVIGWGETPYSVVPAGLNHVTAIAAGDTFSLALRSDGTVVTWGTGPGTNVPTGLTGITAIAAGVGYGLALRSSGTVVAWGFEANTNLPANLTNVTAISANNYANAGVEDSGAYSLAIRSNGTVVAWGYGYAGDTNPPAALSNLLSVAVTAAPYHGLALVNDGSPQILQPPVGLTTYTGRSVTLQARAVGAAPLSYQWLLNGTNIPGATSSSLVFPNIQLANAGKYQLFVSNSIATALSLPAPVNVIKGGSLAFLSQTSASATNVYQGGKVTFYGGAVLGSGPLAYQWFFSPTNWSPYTYNLNYIAIPGATNDTLVLDPALAMQSGSYYLAVSNGVSSIGLGGTVLGNGSGNLPVSLHVLFAKAWGYFPTDPPFVLTNATAIAVGNYGQPSQTGDYLALSSAGRISSWSGGFVEYGETNFSALSNSIVTAIAAGDGDTLALKSDGTVFALGGTFESIGGSGSVTNVPAAANEVMAIACGDYHDLALRYDGTVVGWGQNTYGQTSNTNATNVVAIAAGGSDSIALRADGSVVTWGLYGQFYPQYPGQYPVPSSASNVVAVAAGGAHFLALRANGTVVGWGQNTYGQVSIPTNWINIVAISAGANHSTALRNDGTVVTVGNAENGLFPNNVPRDLTNVIAIASSGEHDLGLFGTRAPAFTVQPWSRTVFNTATSVWFAAKCAGVQPVSYQWKFNGTNVPGATNDMLTINAAVTNFLDERTALPLQAGIYQLVASNAYGVVASHYAQLTVLIPLGVALNDTNVNWTTFGDNQWFGETNITHDGVSAAQSGDIGPFQDTILQTTVATNMAGLYTFWWKVSSEPDFDFLEFRINGIVQANISGEVDWQQVRIPVPAGTNVLQWHYYKQSIYGSGLDAGWVDQFAFIQSPVILSQPRNLTANAGNFAEFFVEATSQDQTLYPLGYQWQKNGVNLVNGSTVDGANSSGLHLSDLHDYDAGSYTVIVTNKAGGSVTSMPATLTVLDSPPVILRQPDSRTNYAGTTASFTVLAINTNRPSSGLGYQWQKNGVNLAKGVSPTLVLYNVQDADAATYTVIVTNFYGASVTSSPATLTVLDSPPLIVSQSSSLTNNAGTQATFFVNAVGAMPMSYQWQKNGVNLAAAGVVTGTIILTLTNVQDTDAGSYAVIITNVDGSATSAPVTLTVRDGPPVITSQPASVTVFPGQMATFSVAVTGTTPIGYQWQFYGTNLDSITNSWLTIGNAQSTNSGPYRLVATNAYGAVTSSIAILNVRRSWVVAWGDNQYGQTNVPLMPSDVTAIAAGLNHNLALLANGTVAAWGWDFDGQTDVPTSLVNVVAISAGAYHSLALQANGAIAAWGWNGEGQTNVPAGLSNVVAIASGSYHNLALLANGTIASWGYNADGETDVPAGVTNVVAIAAGGYHSLALLASGTVAAWGQDYNGETDVPAGLSNVVAIAAGEYHNLALQADGTVVAWGYNGDGQTSVPAGLTNVVAIAAGYYHSLALQANGTVVVWGYDASGQANVPPDLTNAVAIAGGGYHSLAILNDGSPFITRQPLSQTVSSNATVQFTVTALGVPALGYQWLKNGVNLTDGGNVSGSSTASLDLANVQTADMAAYTVVITNGIGSVTSTPAMLVIAGPPVILLQPASQTVNFGTSVQLVVMAIGNPPPTYQWWQNGTNQVGGNNSILTLANVGRAQNGAYAVMVTNALGGICSSNGILKVLVPQQLGSPVLLPDGSLQLTASDVNGGVLSPSDLPNFEAQVSTNLIDWVTLPNALSLTNGTLLLQDNSRTNRPASFYRIIEH